VAALVARQRDPSFGLIVVGTLVARFVGGDGRRDERWAEPLRRERERARAPRRRARCRGASFGQSSDPHGGVPILGLRETPVDRRDPLVPLASRHRAV